MYFRAADHGWPYFALTIVLLVLAQDTYFYWTHRAMHHPWLYRRVHHVHHLSRNPSPWAAYSFAPAEALVHAAFVRSDLRGRVRRDHRPPGAGSGSGSW